MQRRRVLSFVLSACIICGLICGTASASGLPELPSWDIDPWGDLEQVRPTPTPELPDRPHRAPASVTSLEPGKSTEYTLSFGGGGVTTFSFYRGSTYCVGSDGVKSYNATTVYEDLSGPQGLYFADSAKSNLYGGGLTLNINTSNAAHFTISQPTSYTVKENSVVTLSGSILQCFAGLTQRGTSSPSSTTSSTNFMFPASAQFIINGNLFGDVLTVSSTGYLDFSDYELDVSSLAGTVINTFGIRFFYPANTAGSKDFTPLNGYYTWIYLKYNELNFTADWGEKVAPTPTPSPPPQGTTEEGEQERHEETKGLLETIIDAVVNLPGKLASALLDGIKGLFIPTEDELAEIKSRYEELLSTKLGFVWQAGEWIIDFFTNLLEAFSPDASHEFMFPGITFAMNGETYEIVPAQAVDLNNDMMRVVQPVLGTIVCIVCVLAVINMGEHMVVALISGKSYFDFLKGGGGE